MRPMLATRAAPGAALPGAGWCHEVKWDGIRALVERRAGTTVVRSRSARDISVAFPELAPIAGDHEDLLLDGEVVRLRDGVPSFAGLAERIHLQDAATAARLARARPVTYVVFDLLRRDGTSLLSQSLRHRREALEAVSLGAGRWIRSPLHDEADGLWAATSEQGLEGIVSKRWSSTYHPGRRSPDWVKRAHRRTQACVVGGWRPRSDGSGHIGALLLGLPGDGGRLVAVGRVGSGLDAAASRRLLDLLEPVATAPFDAPVEDAADAVWCRPAVVVEVLHLGRTDAGRLRQPVYRGVRADLSPADVEKE